MLVFNFKKFCFYLLFVFLVCFSFHNVGIAHEKNVDRGSFKNKEVDYSFTTQEINLATITDTSISISSENLDKDLFSKRNSFFSKEGYTISFENECLVISGLIPDFLYNNLYVELDYPKDNKYTLQIKNFKTLKSKRFN